MVFPLSGRIAEPRPRPGEVSFITCAMWLHTLMEEGRRAVLEAAPHFLGRGFSLCRAALFCSWDMENNRVKRGGSLHSLLSCEEGRHSLKGFAAKKIWNEKMSKNTILHDMVIKIVSMLFPNKYK